METSFWVSTWCLFIFICLFPNTLLGLVHILKFGRVFDLLVVMALMILSIVVFMSYFAQKEGNAKLEKFVRQQAITEAAHHSTKSKK
jgi:hypothetical protein